MGPFVEDVSGENAIFELPGWRLDSPRAPPDGPKFGQDGPQMAQDSPRWPQDGSRWQFEKRNAELLRASIAMGPFFEDIPSENAVFHLPG